MKTVEFKDKLFLDSLFPNGEDKFVCIWDTDSFDCCEKDIRKLIKSGCVAFISFGKRAEELHDIFDEVLIIINVIENNNSSDIFVDTLWQRGSDNNLSEAVYNAQHCMIEEVDIACNKIYAFTKKH